MSAFLLDEQQKFRKGTFTVGNTYVVKHYREEKAIQFRNTSGFHRLRKSIWQNTGNKLRNSPYKRGYPNHPTETIKFLYSYNPLRLDINCKILEEFE
jgi:hypothetical protein